MKDKEILLKKTLIEIYDRELQRNGRFHVLYSGCRKCKSITQQRKSLIMDLKKELFSTKSKREVTK